MKIKTANDLNHYLRSLCRVEEPSTDQLLAGDGETVIQKVGTCWMPYFKTIKEAYRQGVNVLVTHEPLFYSGWDMELEENEYNELFMRTGSVRAREQYLAMIQEKKTWIEAHQMAVIRCHDVLDRLKDTGIADSFAVLLGFQKERLVFADDFLRVYEIEEQTAGEIAVQIARLLKSAGQQGLAFYGDKEKKIKTIGIGTGCYSNPIELMEHGAQMCISLNDVIRTWVQAAYAADSGYPLVVIDHGTSEESGVESLCRLLKQKLDCECIHFPQGCGFEWIRG